MLDKLAESNGVAFETDLRDDCTILILEDDLYQIVFNLAENAIKYNVTGGKVYITLQKAEDNAVLQIRDTGMGIPEESLSHIFERFYRVDKARARKSGGSGLGLSIVRNMVERNQGAIKVESTVGEGTTFTLIFPEFDTEEQA
jgi:two-component system phosphate regulon sensor histidine kinase PhoR